MRCVWRRARPQLTVRAITTPSRLRCSGPRLSLSTLPPGSMNGHPKYHVVRLESTNLEVMKGGIEVTQHGKPSNKTLLPTLWLRDNCRCSECVNQDTMQRNFDTFKISSDITPTHITNTGQHIKITWSDQHQSEYGWDFIETYTQHGRRAPERTEVQYFTSWMSGKDNPPSVRYSRVMEPDDKGVAELTSKIRKHGFVIVEGTPFKDPEDTKRLLERISFIRETHYGGFYDFTPDLSMADTAYTNLALAAHTDTTYFTDPAGLQAFHLLSHKAAPDAAPTEPPSGGESILVDGFFAASELKKQHPKYYDILSKVRLPWHASGNKGIIIAPDKRYPVLELDEDTGELHRIRWNNDDRGVVPFRGPYSPEEWYAAARAWTDILRRVECRIQLVPGKTLIFDNWRVLHGRTAFQGIRRICGAYINRDDFMSRWRTTNVPHEINLQNVVG